MLVYRDDGEVTLMPPVRRTCLEACFWFESNATGDFSGNYSYTFEAETDKIPIIAGGVAAVVVIAVVVGLVIKGNKSKK